MVGRDEIMDVLRTVDDPEMPINIVDLGMVGGVRIERAAGNDLAGVSVDLLPTFVGCFALPAIEAEVRKRVAALPGVNEVEVVSRFDPPWTVDRISPAGRESLRRHGVTVPSGDVRCPFCDSADVRVDSPFGTTRCRMIYYCEACKNGFEHLKQVKHGGGAIQIGRLPGDRG